MTKRLDLTEGSILQGFALFALPLFFGSLFQQLYGTVDLLYVGNFLGANAAASIGASSIVVTCLIGLFTGISVGAGIVTAQAIGARDSSLARQYICNALFGALVGGILLIGIGEIFAEPILSALATPEGIFREAAVYIRIYMLSILPMILYNMSAGILRAMGDSRTPFLVLAAGGITNVAADALFIVVLRRGVAGAALATLVSQSFAGVLLTAYLLVKEKPFHKRWKIEPELLLQIFRVGLPLGLQSMFLTLSNLFVQHDINGFGETTIAAFTVYYKIENLLYLPVVAFGQAMVSFVGQNYGAGKTDRIRRGALLGNLFAGLVTVGLSLIVILFGRSLFGLFCSDEAVISVGVRLMSVAFPFYFLYSIQEVTGGVARGIGKTTQSMLVILLCLCVSRVLLLKLLVAFIGSPTSIAVVYPLTWGLAAVSFVLYDLYLSRQKLI